MSAYDSYEIVLGLETHVRVKSHTKMFCRCKNSLELETEPNINTCPFCMGFPGALPYINKEVVRLGVRASHAMNCTINHKSSFDRKSYSYPDLPNGYQVTQLFTPIAEHGQVSAYVNSTLKTFGICRMHLEIDAGKLIHAGSKTLCDYNRSGSPLMEIVTDPDFRSKEDVMEYLIELQKLLRYSEAADADMDKGQLRCDVNISIRKKGETILNNRVELKNLNSFSAIGRAIDAEFCRQVEIVEMGGVVSQETRGWNDEKGISTSQRSKEDSMDYRYFPEPDLPELILDTSFVGAEKVYYLPIERRQKYLQEFNLLEDDARILSAEKDLSDFFEELCAKTTDPKKSCSYITTVVFPLIKESSKEFIFGKNDKLTVANLSEVILMINKNELSSTNAKKVVEELFEKGGEASIIVDTLGLRQNNDTGAMKAVVEQIIATHPEQVAQYKEGDNRLFGFLVGQCMKASAGKGNPKMMSDLLKEILG